MKLIETLTKQQKIDMFRGEVVGIFPAMILPIDSFYSKLPDLCLGYYTARSGLKPISVMYELLQEYEENGLKAEHNIGKFIRGKYIDKWERIYSVLLESQYDTLNNYEHSESKSVSGNNNSSHSDEKTKNSNNSDTISYDLGVIDEGKKGTHEVKTIDTYDNDDVYGFNSVESVPSNSSKENTSETIIGDSDKNTSYNKQSKTGTESVSVLNNESERQTSKNNINHSMNEDVMKHGRNVSGAEMVQRELNLRNTQIFFDIIYRDIDSIATLEIYI